MNPEKVCILGLDCADPTIVFERWRSDLPNLSALLSGCFSARLRSTDPPITVPAWMSMMTGRDPGTLGIYGFRNRDNYSYDAMSIASARKVTHTRLWDFLGRSGRKVVCIGVPLTYPPSPVNGTMVSGMLTPSSRSTFTFPSQFREDIFKIAPAYRFDISDYRNLEDKDLITQVYSMTAQRFKLIRHCISKMEWDFLMAVEIGLDRMQHRFWSEDDDSMDSAILHDYYIYLDKEIGTVLNCIKENSHVLIVSDHGAQASRGMFCINDWLISKGFLTLRKSPAAGVPLSAEDIDWKNTKVWAEAGYYARLNLNIKGREPDGIVLEKDFESLRDEISDAVSSLYIAESDTLPAQALRPQEIYEEVQGVAPDMMIYIDDLKYRAIASTGHASLTIKTCEKDRDRANHSHYGLCILSGPGIKQNAGGEVEIYDVTPTILDVFGLETEIEFRGSSLLE